MKMGTRKFLRWYIVPGFPNYRINKRSEIQSFRRGEWVDKKPTISQGRTMIRLWKNAERHTLKVSVVMAITFLGHKPGGYGIIVDHKNNDPMNDKLSNLQLISTRENTSKDRKNKSSKYTGVYWHSRSKRWRARIRIKIGKENKQKTLGRFMVEEDARDAYQKALAEINNHTILLMS